MEDLNGNSGGEHVEQSTLIRTGSVPRSAGPWFGGSSTISGFRSSIASNGELIGKPRFSYPAAGCGLVALSVDIAAIVEKLIQGDFTSGLGHRRVPVGTGSFEFIVDLQKCGDTRTVALEAGAESTLAIGIEVEGDGRFHLSDPIGIVLGVDDNLTGIEHGTAEPLTSGSQFLQAGIASHGRSDPRFRMDAGK